MRQHPVIGVEISGIGAALPRTRLNNNQLIARHKIESSSKWIFENSGIRQRYIGEEDETVVALGTEACLLAIRSTGLKSPVEHPPRTFDYLYVASSTADTYRPISGAHPGILKGLAEHRIKGRAGDDLNIACTGFVKQLERGYTDIPTHGYTRSLVVGTEKLSDRINPKDRGTVILFGDGAGAVELTKVEGSESGLYGWWQETDPNEEEILYANAGEYVYMEGPKVLRRAREAMTAVGEAALAQAEENAGVTREQIKYVVPHQANTRIFYYAAEKLGFSEDQVLTSISRYGNVSTASIPLTLRDAYRQGKIQRGDKLMLNAFGGGMTMEAMIIQV